MEAAITSALTFSVGTTARAGVGSEQMETIAQVYWKPEEVYCTTPSMPNDVALKVTESLYSMTVNYFFHHCSYQCQGVSL